MAERWEEAPPFYLQLDIRVRLSGYTCNRNYNRNHYGDKRQMPLSTIKSELFTY